MSQLKAIASKPTAFHHALHAMIRSPSVPSVFGSTVKLSQGALAALNEFKMHGGRELRERLSYSLSLTSSFRSPTRYRYSPIL